MSTLSISLSLSNVDRDEVPSFDDMAGNMPGFIFGQNDRQELNAWLDSKEVPPTDAELDSQWAQEMVLRDGQDSIEVQVSQIDAEIERLEQQRDALQAVLSRRFAENLMAAITEAVSIRQANSRPRKLISVS